MSTIHCTRHNKSTPNRPAEGKDKLASLRRRRRYFRKLEDLESTALYRGKRHYEFNGRWFCEARPYSHASRERSDSGVQVVVSDKRISVSDGELEVEYLKAVALAAMDYYPFGMLSKTPPPGDQDTLLRNPDRSASEVSGMMPDRQWSANSDTGLYKFGFNGMERDNEVSGHGNNLDFGARIYDARFGRWLSMDPLQQKHPNLNPYNFVSNNPIVLVDPDGKKIKLKGTKEEKAAAIKLMNRYLTGYQVETHGLFNNKVRIVAKEGNAAITEFDRQMLEFIQHKNTVALNLEEGNDKYIFLGLDNPTQIDIEDFENLDDEDAGFGMALLTRSIAEGLLGTHEAKQRELKVLLDNYDVPINKGPNPPPIKERDQHNPENNQVKPGGDGFIEYSYGAVVVTVEFDSKKNVTASETVQLYNKKVKDGNGFAHSEPAEDVIVTKDKPTK